MPGQWLAVFNGERDTGGNQLPAAIAQLLRSLLNLHLLRKNTYDYLVSNMFFDTSFYPKCFREDDDSQFGQGKHIFFQKGGGENKNST